MLHPHSLPFSGAWPAHLPLPCKSIPSARRRRPPQLPSIQAADPSGVEPSSAPVQASRKAANNAVSLKLAASSTRASHGSEHQQTHTHQHQQHERQPQYVLEPNSKLDVDADLWQVLDLCSDEELESIYALLYAPSPFSPMVKSLVAESEPALLGLRGRLSVMHKVEARFRFLAADSASLLHGRRPSYRDTLLSIRHRMDVPCSANLATYDLETEVFLHTLKNCVEYVQGEADLTDPQQAASAAYAQEGDGMGSSSHRSQRGGNWTERMTAPFRFGLKELAPTLAKLGSAMTLTAVGRSTLHQLAAQLVSSHLKYQAALRGSSGILGGWGKKAVLEAAQKGLSAATARYSAIQGALSFLGPVMWGWLALDLAYKSIGTDYARVFRAVFVLAQVRLVSTGGFIQPSPSDSSSQGTTGPHQHQTQQQRSQSHSSKSAIQQEVVVDGDAWSKGVVSAVVPYTAGGGAGGLAGARPTNLSRRVSIGSSSVASVNTHPSSALAGSVAAGVSAANADLMQGGVGLARSVAAGGAAFSAGLVLGGVFTHTRAAAAAAAASGSMAQPSTGHSSATTDTDQAAAPRSSISVPTVDCAAAEDAEVLAALQLHPHFHRHLLDCSEELCDDDSEEDCCLYYGGEEDDSFCDSAC